jgi:hypothetical protein
MPIKFIAIGTLALAIVFGLWKGIAAVRESGREEIRAQWKQSAYELAEQSRKDVERVRHEEKAKYDEAQRQHAEKEQAEREAQQKRTDEDQRRITDLERRYRKALVEDSSCQAWSDTPVTCPLE